MKKMLLIAAFVAAASTSVQTASAQTKERKQPTMAQLKRAKMAKEKMEVAITVPTTMSSFKWDGENWVTRINSQITYDETALPTSITNDVLNSDGEKKGVLQLLLEYDDNDNVTALELKNQNTTEEWQNIYRVEFTYDDVVTDFCTRCKTMVWDSEKQEYAEGSFKMSLKSYLLEEIMPEVYTANNGQAFYYDIERDEQGRVTSLKKFKLNTVKSLISEEGEELTPSYRQVGGLSVSYADDGSATIDYASSDLMPKSPAKNKMHRKMYVGDEEEFELYEHLNVKEWKSFDGQLLVDDPYYDLFEGENRIKSAEYVWGGGDPATITATYGDDDSYNAEIDFGDGYKEIYKLDITDDNGSCVYTEIDSDETDVDTGTGKYWNYQYETKISFDEYGTMTNMTYRYPVGGYNSGDPKMYDGGGYSYEPTYDEDGNMTEIIMNEVDYGYDFDTDTYNDPSIYPQYKETYGDFEEIVFEVDKINNMEKAAANGNAPKYNLAGQRVNDSYRGIVIQNGKKYLKK